MDSFSSLIDWITFSCCIKLLDCNGVDYWWLGGTQLGERGANSRNEAEEQVCEIVVEMWC